MYDSMKLFLEKLLMTNFGGRFWFGGWTPSLHLEVLRGGPGTVPSWGESGAQRPSLRLRALQPTEHREGIQNRVVQREGRPVTGHGSILKSPNPPFRYAVKRKSVFATKQSNENSSKTTGGMKLQNWELGLRTHHVVLSAFLPSGG